MANKTIRLKKIEAEPEPISIPKPKPKFNVNKCKSLADEIYRHCFMESGQGRWNLVRRCIVDLQDELDKY